MNEEGDGNSGKRKRERESEIGESCLIKEREREGELIVWEHNGLSSSL